MKWSLLIAVLFFATGCRSDDSEASEPTPPQKEDPLARNLKRAALLNEKQELLNQLERLITKTKLDPDGQIAALETATRQAQGRFIEIRKTHPLLLKVNAELERWTTLARAAKLAGKPDEVQRANAQIAKARGNLNKMAQSLPELTDLQKNIEKNKIKVSELRKSIASQTPEGQAIVARLEEIDIAINE